MEGNAFSSFRFSWSAKFVPSCFQAEKNDASFFPIGMSWTYLLRELELFLFARSYQGQKESPIREIKMVLFASDFLGFGGSFLPLYYRLRLFFLVKEI